MTIFLLALTIFCERTSLGGPMIEPFETPVNIVSHWGHNGIFDTSQS